MEATIHELMDLAWDVVYDLLGDWLDVEECKGSHAWIKDLTRYTVVHPGRSRCWSRT